ELWEPSCLHDPKRPSRAPRAVGPSGQGLSTLGAVVDTASGAPRHLAPAARRTAPNEEVQMSVFYNRSDLVEIGADEGVRLVHSRRVGRLGFVADGQPLIFPVNYAVDGETIVFRTDPGTKLDSAPLTKVAFEVDDIDETNGEGWDVLIQGRADDIT